MKFLLRFSIPTRLLVAFTVALGFLVFIAFVGIHELRKSSNILDNITRINNEKIIAAAAMQAASYNASVTVRNMLIWDDSELLAKEKINLAKHIENYFNAQGRLIRVFENTERSPQEERFYQDILSNQNVLAEGLNRVSNLAATGNAQRAKILMKAEVRPKLIPILYRATDIVTYEQGQNERLAAKAREDFRSSRGSTPESQIFPSSMLQSKHCDDAIEIAFIPDELKQINQTLFV